MARRKRIAVLMASIDRDYQQKFALGVASAGSGYGIDVCVFNSQGHPNVEVVTSDVGECMIYELPDLNDFDGIISLPATTGTDAIQEKMYEVLARVRGKPHVSVDVPRDGAVTLTFDDRSSVEELAEHLILKHGARKFAYVSGPLDSEVAAARLEACRNALERHGLALDDRLVFDGQWTRVGGRTAAEKLLALEGELPDAVMCGNDDMALSVIECLKKHGLRVPGDIIVTGFDATREAQMRNLTTILRPIGESARKAVEILNAWMDGVKPRENTVVLSTVPVFGSSCGCGQDAESVNEKLADLVTEKWDMEAALIRISLLSGTIVGVTDENEARESIRSLTKALAIREFYLCVNPAVCRGSEDPVIQAAYPDEMLLLYGIRDGKPCSPGLFPTGSLTPEMARARDSSSSLVFCPLYYRDQSMGYVAMELGDTTGTALYPVLTLLKGALMSLYMQTSSRRAASIIKRMSVQDIMTGLLNRRGFMEQAPALLERAKSEGKAFVLLCADINRMKFINDQYGHMRGDEAICRMGRALGCLSRYGMTPVHISGDEFLAYGILGRADEAPGLAAAVKSELDRMNREDPWICNITAGVGVYAAVPREGDDIDLFLTRGDQAMYEDKNKRKYGRRRDDIV